jgi:POT family proton-dependent oligopeptide transporter
MRALVYYMTKQLLIGQAQSSFIYGTYTACAYFTPIIGGVIADRYLGKRKAVIIGASIMALGHFMMAFEPLFYTALAAIAIGNGLFLPSLPSQVGDLYQRDDPRRSWAFNVYVDQYRGSSRRSVGLAEMAGTTALAAGRHGRGRDHPGQRYLPRNSRDQNRVRAGFDRHTILIRGSAPSPCSAAYEQVGNTVTLWIAASTGAAGASRS